jgi:exopolysaccharide/PEP-CTERM locus tyrosine autokinase
LESVEKRSAPDISDIESAVFESSTTEADPGPMQSESESSLSQGREIRPLLQNDDAASQLNDSLLENLQNSDSILERGTESRQTGQHTIEDVPSLDESESKKILLAKPPQAKVHVLKESRSKIGEQNEDVVSVSEAPESVEEVKPTVSVPSDELAQVSFDADAIDPKLVALLKPQSFEAEQFKILRTNLLYPTSGIPPRSVLVTSALPGEGKSFVSANLAASVASDIDRHVLLIDCDLRSPSLHRIFGFTSVPGLSDYLARGVPLTSLLQRTHVDKLTILPAGPPPTNPAELLSSGKMSALLQEVYERYGDRMIIIDTPPPQLTAETKALSGKVDGIILVIKYGSTPRDSVTELIARLGEKKIIGSIINNFDLRSSGYYGKYFDKYYGK